MAARALGKADLLRVRTLGYRRRVDQARAVIIEAQRHGRIGVSVSGGKDSTVMLHLVRALVPDAAAAWFDSGAELAGTAALVAQQGAERIAPIRDLPDMCRYAGWWGARNPVDHGASFDVLATLILEPSERFAVAHSLAVMALGLRAHESRGRYRSAAMRGDLYYVESTGLWHLCPLAWWTTADIWAYIAEHDLPYHPAYDAMARIRVPREQQRIGTALGGKAISTGRIAVIKRIDPGLFNRLAAEFPLWAAES